MRRHACSLDLDTVGYIHSRPARASSASHFPETLKSERQLVYHIRASTTLLILTHAHTHTTQTHTDEHTQTCWKGQRMPVPGQQGSVSGSHFHCSVLGVRGLQARVSGNPFLLVRGCAGDGPAGLPAAAVLAFFMTEKQFHLWVLTAHITSQGSGWCEDGRLGLHASPGSTHEK